VAASVLRAALGGHESGVNILLYGPPGTGKAARKPIDAGAVALVKLLH